MHAYSTGGEGGRRRRRQGRHELTAGETKPHVFVTFLGRLKPARPPARPPARLAVYLCVYMRSCFACVFLPG